MSQVEVGSLLANRYEIASLVKEGGMGRVYRAVDRQTGRLVALKEMLPDFAAHVERDLIYQKFEAEARLLESLSHPGIPEVLDYFVRDDLRYIAMEFVEGESLDDLLEDYLALTGKPVPLPLVVECGVHLCGILEYLHSQEPPIVHRDIKPGNIILRKNRTEVVLVDFGLARGVNLASHSPKTMVGTLGYVSLEQIRGQPEPRSDLFALGATMHHLISGKAPRPFDLPLLERVVDDVPSALAALVDRAVQEEPERRFQSASEMKEELLRVLALITPPPQPAVRAVETPPPLPPSALPPITWEGTSVPSPVSKAKSFLRRPLEAASRRFQPGPPVVILAAILLLLGTAGLVIPRLHPPPAAAPPPSAPLSDPSPVHRAAPLPVATLAVATVATPSADPAAIEAERRRQLQQAEEEKRRHQARLAAAPYELFTSPANYQKAFKCVSRRGVLPAPDGRGALLKSDGGQAAAAFFEYQGGALSPSRLQFELPDQKAIAPFVIYLGNYGVIFAGRDSVGEGEEPIKILEAEPEVFASQPLERLNGSAIHWYLYSHGQGNENDLAGSTVILETTREEGHPALSLRIEKAVDTLIHEEAGEAGGWSSGRLGIRLLSTQAGAAVHLQDLDIR